MVEEKVSGPEHPVEAEIIKQLFQEKCCEIGPCGSRRGSQLLEDHKIGMFAEARCRAQKKRDQKLQSGSTLIGDVKLVRNSYIFHDWTEKEILNKGNSYTWVELTASPANISRCTKKLGVANMQEESCMARQ